MLGRGLESLIPPKNPPGGASTGQSSAPAPPLAPSLLQPPDVAPQAPILSQTTQPAISQPAISQPTSPVTSSALPPDTIPKLPEPSKYHEPIFHIEVSKIKRNPFQPRDAHDESQLQELAASIREYGILQPLIVTRAERETTEGSLVEYQLIAGERRLLAAKMIGLERVPAVIKEAPRQEREKLEMALIENIQRADLNPLETARAYARLQDEFGLSQREIGQRLCKSRESIANSIRLLQLPREAQLALADGKINESHARLILAVTDPSSQNNILHEIMSQNLSVRQAQQLIEKPQGAAADTFMPDRQRQDPESEYIKNRLEEALGTRVKFIKRGSRGKITINFFSEEELQNILNKFLKEV